MSTPTCSTPTWMRSPTGSTPCTGRRGSDDRDPAAGLPHPVQARLPQPGAGAGRVRRRPFHPGAPPLPVPVRILAHHQQPADLKRAQNVLTACSIARIFGSETASTSVNVGPTVEPPVGLNCSERSWSGGQTRLELQKDNNVVRQRPTEMCSDCAHDVLTPRGAESLITAFRRIVGNFGGKYEIPAESQKAQRITADTLPTCEIGPPTSR